MTVHSAAATGFSRASEAYERGRPSYPADAIARLVDRLAIGEGKRVLDVGAGTGKLTRLLAPTGATLSALEPVEAMRARLLEILPATTIVGGTAESIAAAAGSFDAIIVAQAFHWFDSARALAEFHRVLASGGKLGLVWNMRDEKQPLFGAISELIERGREDAPTYRSGEWRKGFASTRAFGPLEESAFGWAQTVDEAGLRDRFGSVSFIAASREDERETLLDQIVAVARPHANADGTLTLAYTTHVFVATRSED